MLIITQFLNEKRCKMTFIIKWAIPYVAIIMMLVPNIRCRSKPCDLSDTTNITAGIHHANDTKTLHYFGEDDSNGMDIYLIFGKILFACKKKRKKKQKCSMWLSHLNSLRYMFPQAWWYRCHLSFYQYPYTIMCQHCRVLPENV